MLYYTNNRTVFGKAKKSEAIRMNTDKLVMKKKPVRKRADGPFAQNLKTIFNERGLTQRSAAEIAGVSVATINDWLNGSQPNDLMAVMKLCNTLKCDFQWLLTDSNKRVSPEDLSLSQIFDIEDDPTFSGVFMIEAKKLKRKGEL